MNPSANGTVCATKRRLAAVAEVSARSYYDAVAQLTKRDGNVEQLHAAVEEARRRADAARVSLEEHLDSHGC